jgi:hypothetical protein
MVGQNSRAVASSGPARRPDNLGMNRYSALSAAALTSAALFLVSCDPSVVELPGPAPAVETRAPARSLSPKVGALQTAKSFYRALQTDAVEQAERLVVVVKKIGREELTKELKSFSKALRTRWIEIGVHESRESGPCALVVVSMKFHNGKEFVTRLREEMLLRRDDRWFVVPEAFRSDPDVSAAMGEHGKRLFKAYREQLPALVEKYTRR